uniref:Uncharacterized protein n=1 Tax=Arundo donax TaxID=35708 RepID=A0A0A8ZYN8_ARUDO
MKLRWGELSGDPRGAAVP